MHTHQLPTVFHHSCWLWNSPLLFATTDLPASLIPRSLTPCLEIDALHAWLQDKSKIVWCPDPPLHKRGPGTRLNPGVAWKWGHSMGFCLVPRAPLLFVFTIIHGSERPVFYFRVLLRTQTEGKNNGEQGTRQGFGVWVCIERPLTVTVARVRSNCCTECP